MQTTSKGISKTYALKRKLAVKIGQVGLGGTVRLALAKFGRQLRNLGSLGKPRIHPFDIKHGTDTSGIVEVGALDIPDERIEHAVRYQTAIVEVFEAVLNELTIQFEEFVFIDLGSGKGRAMLLASRLPFKAIVGVEISPELHRIACRNIEVYKDESQRCHDIKSLCQDAARFDIPEENILFYLFNPFDSEVMRPVLSNIEASLQKCPRTIYICYLKALCRELLDSSPFFHVWKETERYIIYASGRA